LILKLKENKYYQTEKIVYKLIFEPTFVYRNPTFRQHW